MTGPLPFPRPRLDLAAQLTEAQTRYDTLIWPHVQQLARLSAARREVLLTLVLAGNPWALHTAATLPGWAAFAGSRRR